MDDATEYRFIIDAFSPETLPMSRLAEYMVDLAKLAGEEDKVHFRRLDKGSAVIVHWVEPVAAPKVRQRISLAKAGSGPAEPMRAIERINEKLEEDGVSGVLTQGGAEIIRFPGHKVVDDVLVGPITQHTSLQGVVIRIGGTKDLVPVHFTVEGTTTQARCVASRDMAKQLARHIFGPELRVEGPGAWVRRQSGQWFLSRLTIRSFEPLARRALADELADLRGVYHSWADSADPWTELARLRRGSEEARE